MTGQLTYELDRALHCHLSRGKIYINTYIKILGILVHTKYLYNNNIENMYIFTYIKKYVLLNKKQINK